MAGVSPTDRPPGRRPMLSFDAVVDRVAARPRPLLVAIDGLPVSGKTSLGERLIGELGAQCLWLDEFVKPEAEWPSRDTPSFPFDYIRYAAGAPRRADLDRPMPPRRLAPSWPADAS
jgi:hypothetical protein